MTACYFWVAVQELKIDYHAIWIYRAKFRFLKSKPVCRPPPHCELEDVACGPLLATPLWVACREGHASVVRMLLDAKANQDTWLFP